METGEHIRIIIRHSIVDTAWNEGCPGLVFPSSLLLL